jgi:hypothetical protein
LLSTPVVLIAFRRPEVTRRNIDALRAVAPEDLYVIVDGPRIDRPEEAEQVAAVRAVIGEVDWPCRIHERYAAQNLGLEANVELGLDWVFSQVDRAIVLEDDCIPDPSFFAYCEELLDRYADNPNVWQIGGDRHGVAARLFEGRSYAFTTWASVWGWATWADRWHDHRSEFPRDHAGAAARFNQTPRTADAIRTAPITPAEGSLATDAARRHFTFVSTNTDGDAYGWDHHWWCTIMSRGGFSTTPAFNTVENDGYGEGATHTRAEKEPEPAETMPFPLVHPDLVALDQAVEAELELILLRTDGRLSRLARKLIRPLWMRAIARKLVSNPLVWRLVRHLVGR